MYSRAPIRKGTVIGCFDGVARTFEIDADGAVDYGPYNRSQAVEVAIADQHVVALVPGLDQPLAGIDFINHSCTPNCRVEGYVVVIADEEIPAGTELTIDYRPITLIPEQKPCLCRTDCSFVL